MRILPAQGKLFLTILESYSVFQNQFADFKVDISLKLTRCLDFPCVICFNLFFCWKADMDCEYILFKIFTVWETIRKNSFGHNSQKR